MATTFTTGERRLLAKFNKLPFGVRRQFSMAQLRIALQEDLPKEAKGAIFAETRVRQEASRDR